MKNLTCAQVKQMPISMQIIRAIKSEFGIPEWAGADTYYGYECATIVLCGLSATDQELSALVKKYKTPEMIDCEDAVDSCVTILLDKPLDIYSDITDVFKEA